MSEFIYEATDQQRHIAQDIYDLKNAEKVIKARLKELALKLADQEVDSIDFVDAGSRKHLRFSVQRRTTWEYSVEAIKAFYPNHAASVVKVVEDRAKLSRLIKAGIIDPEKIGTSTLGDPYVGPVTEWAAEVQE